MSGRYNEREAEHGIQQLDCGTVVARMKRDVNGRCRLWKYTIPKTNESQGGRLGCIIIVRFVGLDHTDCTKYFRWSKEGVL